MNVTLKGSLLAALLGAAILPLDARAAEPNETWESATALSPGALTVADELRQPPDTLLGTRNLFGDIEFVDDDGSPVGNGVASGIGGVPTNSGTIRFAVTGYGDDFFEGSHGEVGRYEVFVQPYDFFGDPVDEFSVVRTMTPGVVEEFEYSDADWINGSYDVYIDNLIDFEGFADVDFYRFTGLTPGASFTAETLDPQSTGVDTRLGWFSPAGALLLDNDDFSLASQLSRIADVVPANGELILAVTGGLDNFFQGDHQAVGSYELTITLAGGGDYAADFNDDGKVDGLDLATWKGAFGSTALGDANGDEATDGADFLIWQREFGSGAASGAAAAVPEPTSIGLLLSGAAVTAIGLLRQPPAAGRRGGRR